MVILCNLPFLASITFRKPYCCVPNRREGQVPVLDKNTTSYTFLVLSFIRFGIFWDIFIFFHFLLNKLPFFRHFFGCCWVDSLIIVPLTKFVKEINAHIIIMVPRIVQVFLTKKSKILKETGLSSWNKSSWKRSIRVLDSVLHV